MFDIFYIGIKPNLSLHEQSVGSIEQARELSKTRFCWVISYLADYSGFDFLWEPVPWQQDYIHVWPNQWHQYSGTFLVPKKATDNFHFHTKVIPNLHSREHWHMLHPIEESQWDWSWAPHPMDPPYIYVWGNQHWPGEKMPTVEYRVHGATEIKFMEGGPTLRPQTNNWQIPSNIDPLSVDQTWVPDPQDPPYIYEFATQWQLNGGARYVVPGATEIKYMSQRHVRLSDTSNWNIFNHIDADSIDFSWHPSNTEQPYIYEFATQWQPNGGARYVVPGATEIKYVDKKHLRLPDRSNWEIPKDIDADSIDFSWHPSNTEQPYIYECGTQWQPNGGARFVIPSATEIKYIDQQHLRMPNDANWTVPNAVDRSSIDFSWHPSNTEQPYIYEFATQWQPNGGAQYVVPGATEIKYIEHRHVRLTDTTNWNVPADIKADSIDFSWHPSNTEHPYIYEFGTQWQPNGGAKYVVSGATEIQYVDQRNVR